MRGEQPALLGELPVAQLLHLESEVLGPRETDVGLELREPIRKAFQALRFTENGAGALLRQETSAALIP